jgi:serine/threonine-protein kinase
MRLLAGVSAVAELANTQFGYFTLGSVLGFGKTGVVFRAADTRDSSEVALKVFVPQFSCAEDSAERLTRAVKTVHPLKHRNLARLNGGGRSEGSCWLSYELVEGPSVAWLVTLAGAGKGNWQSALQVAMDGARALMYLHGKGLLHGNLTPENLLVCRTEGLVKVGDSLSVRPLESAGADDSVGDVRYLAPERAKKGAANAGDPRSDLYSLGAIVYAVLTGKPPIEGADPEDTLKKIQTASPVPLRDLQPNIPPNLEAVVNRLLDKDPEGRFEDATELMRQLLVVDSPVLAVKGPTWVG